MGFYRWTFDAVVPEKYLTEYFFPAWRTTIGTGKVRGPMCSYNSVNGVASCSNDFFNNQLVRNEWGLDGFVVSDCGEIRGLDVENNHGTSAHPYTKQVNGTMSCQAALRGGCDSDCGSTFGAHMLDALAEGTVLPSEVTLAARHLLKPTIELGLLDGSDAPFQQLGPDDIDTPAHRQLALEAGTEAMTLLKNAKPAGASAPLLPLSSKSGTVAVIGPASNFTQELLANYHGWNTVVNTHSPWMAMSERLGSRLVASELGCERRVVATAGVMSCDVMDNGTASIADAVAAAKAADTVLLFVGTNPIGNVVSCPPNSATCRLTTEAEAVDRVSIGLPGMQSALTKAVLAANPNTVLVMLNAGPLAIDWEAENVPAIVEAFFPGELGGDAVAAVLMGDVAPAGRLPVTIYPADYISRNMTDYDLASCRSSDRNQSCGTTHLYYTGKPLFTFGWGMSYTAFTFGIAAGPQSKLTTGDIVAGIEPLTYFVRVTNTGPTASAVSVVALLSSEHADAATNEKLVAFEKTPVLRPRESTTVRLEVTKERLALIDALGDERIAAGEYRLRLGGAGSGATRDDDFAQASLTLRGADTFMWRLSEAKARWRVRSAAERKIL
jgi:hypothetical protein